MSDVVLTDQDTERVITVLSGAQSVSHLYDGRVTVYAASDRASRQNGTVELPERVRIAGVLSANGVGQSAVESLKRAIVEAKAGATQISIGLPGRAPIPDMQIERVGYDIGSTIDTAFTMDLIERRSASSRTVELQPIRRAGARDGGPRADIEPGQASEEDLGTRPTSILASGLNSLTGLLP